MRQPTRGRSPYLAALVAVPTATVRAVQADLRAGEHPLDVAFAHNLLVGVVELIATQLSNVDETGTLIARLSQDALHRIRTRIELGENVERIAEAEHLPVEAVLLIRSRSENAARKRAARQAANESAVERPR